MGFFQAYFLDPIRVEQGYTYINTIVYALIAFGALYLLNRLFKKINIDFDINFLFQLLPFVVLGSFLRVLVDRNEIRRAAWNVSPGIYIAITSLFLLSFGIALIIKNRTKIDTWKTVTMLGSSILLGVIASSLPLRLDNLIWSGFILSFFLLLILVSHIIFERLDWEWVLKPLVFFAFLAQLFDATVTAFLIQFFGAVEKHPLPRLVIEYFGSGFAFYPLKIGVVLVALYYISKEVKDKSFRNLLIISIIILGLAQGLRNFLGFLIF